MSTTKPKADSGTESTEATDAGVPADATELVANHDAKLAAPLPVISDSDAREGEFVSFDLEDKVVKAAFKDAGLDGDAGKGAGNYGVWYSTTREGNAIVRLRDSTNAYVTLPPAALSPDSAGGRR